MNYKKNIALLSITLDDIKKDRDQLEREVEEMQKRIQFLDWLSSPSFPKNNRVKLKESKAIMGWNEQEVSILNVSFYDGCESGIRVEVDVRCLDGNIVTKVLDAGWFEWL